MSSTTDALMFAFMNLGNEEQAGLIADISSYLRENEMEKVLHHRDVKDRLDKSLKSEARSICPCCGGNLSQIVELPGWSLSTK